MGKLIVVFDLRNVLRVVIVFLAMLIMTSFGSFTIFGSP